MGEMKVNALAPWFGSKRTLAPEIVRQLGPHAAYWEPFCGSCSVLLAKPPCTMETVNDLHGDLINLARVVRDPRLGPQLYRRLRRTLACQTLHEEAAARLKERKASDPAPPEPDLDRAADYFLVSWMGRSGVAGSKKYSMGFCVRYTRKGGHGATRWVSAVDSIPAWHRRLRPVTVLSMDGLRLLQRVADDDRTAIYADPPYLVKGAEYTHDFTSEDHSRLAEQLRRFRAARVVVSYYEHPRLAELYPGWELVRCPVAKSLVNQGRRDSGGKVTAPEVLLVNGPALGGGLFGDSDEA